MSEFDELDDTHVDRVQDSLSLMNGLSFNRLSSNGIAINGIAINGIAINGIAINGIAINGIAINGIAIHGVPIDNLAAQDFTTIYQYMVECALPNGQPAMLYSKTGQPLTFYGSLSLAPEWYSGPLSATGQKKVSACLAARANGNGQPVLISLRGSGITVPEYEKDTFRTHEGIFWGNLFQTSGVINTCVVDGGGLSGRICAESTGCGFNLQGDCADVCVYDPALREYTSCGGETNLIHTWLNLSHRMIFGELVTSRLNGDHQAVGWGDNRFAQFAVNPSVEDMIESAIGIHQLGSDNDELYIHNHGCSRKTNGDIYCWGKNGYGQVGNATIASPIVNPVMVGSDAAQISIGPEHTCSLRTDGLVFCWGRNHKGQLGINRPSTPFWNQPKRVVGLSSVIRLSSGSTSANHTCAVASDGLLWCWGWNQYGTVGDGTTSDRHAPVAVSTDDQGNPFANVTALCTGHLQTCARKSDGSLWCWGVLGTSVSNKPHRIMLDPANPGLSVSPDGLACGSRHSCAVASDSTVWCSGDNAYGQLGFATGGLPVNEPEQVPLPGPVSFVSAARTHTCATLIDNSVWCWGTDPGVMHGKPALFSPQLTLTPQQVNI